MKPAITYDKDTNAAYIRFSAESVFESEEISHDIVFDYDSNGKIVGMEILDASKLLTSAMLSEAA